MDDLQHKHNWPVVHNYSFAVQDNQAVVQMDDLHHKEKRPVVQDDSFVVQHQQAAGNCPSALVVVAMIFT